MEGNCNHTGNPRIIEPDNSKCDNTNLNTVNGGRINIHKHYGNNYDLSEYVIKDAAKGNYRIKIDTDNRYSYSGVPMFVRVVTFKNFQKENAEQLSFEDESFDFVLCKEAYHHFPRPMIALYEMIRRRCRLIVLSDAAADAGFTFGELANAIEKCKVDLGVEILVPPDIEIYSRDASKKKKSKGKRYFIAPIIYPEQVGTDAEGKSWLLYCRPTLYGNEPVDIQHYAATNEAYPHQSTGDQFFDERQFEAYRRLGRFTMDEILDDYKVVEVFRSNGLNCKT
jgi:SAM-dependent methyltransferase